MHGRPTYSNGSTNAPPPPTQHLDNAVLDDIRASHTEIQTGIDTEGLNCVYNASEEQTCLAGGGGGRIIRDLLNSGARTYFNAVPTDNNFNTAHKC